MKKKRIISVINIILIAVFVTAAVNIVRIYVDYGKVDSTYGNIEKEYIIPDGQSALSEDADGENQSAELTGNSDGEKQDADSEKNEADAFDLTFAVDFESLLQRNADVVGWLYCPDTPISYPVVQGENNDQYLRRDLDGNYLIGGTLFMDYRGGALEKGTRHIMYGHNMKNGSMFGLLPEYKSQAYFESHPVMYYVTPDGNYRLELFAGLVVRRDDRIYDMSLDEEEWTELLNSYRAASTFESDTELQCDDIIVTLSTCSYEFDNARYIIIGRLVPM